MNRKGIRHFIGLPEKGNHKENEWEITILRTGEYYIPMPYRIVKSKSIPMINDGRLVISEWTNIKTEVILTISRNCVNPHTFLRLYTYRMSEDIMSLSDQCQIEISPIKKRGEYLVLIPDCHNQHVWNVIFDADTVWQEGKILFTLKYRPDNWKEVIGDYYQIVSETFNLHKRIGDFKKALDQCYLLCYSILDDTALIIAKTELFEEDVFSIMSNIASEESLELKITRQT